MNPLPSPPGLVRPNKSRRVGCPEGRCMVAVRRTKRRFQPEAHHPTSADSDDVDFFVAAGMPLHVLMSVDFAASRRASGRLPARRSAVPPQHRPLNVQQLLHNAGTLGKSTALGCGYGTGRLHRQENKDSRSAPAGSGSDMRIPARLPDERECGTARSPQVVTEIFAMKTLFFALCLLARRGVWTDNFGIPSQAYPRSGSSRTRFSACDGGGTVHFYEFLQSFRTWRAAVVGGGAATRVVTPLGDVARNLRKQRADEEG